MKAVSLDWTGQKPGRNREYVAGGAGVKPVVGRWSSVIGT